MQVTKEAKERLAELEATIAAEEAEIGQLQADAAGLTAEAERLTAALENVGGPKLRKQRALVDRLQQVFTRGIMSTKSMPALQGSGLSL